MIGLLVAALLGCSTLSTLEGARPLAPRQTQFGVAMSLQTGSNPLSYAGIPIPQLEFVGRVGLAPDLDFGFRAYILGAGFDMRYRFWHARKLHLAVAPGVGGVFVPTLGGSLEARAPVIVEYELSRRVAISGGPRVVMRDQINPVALSDAERGKVSRIDVFTGGGARLEARLGRTFVLGFGGDVYAQPARHVIPGWAIGVDMGFRKAIVDPPPDAPPVP